MLQRFREFPRLRGLVFGALGEVSPDVDGIVKILAHAGATVHGLARGGTTVAAATGQLAWLIKRRLARIDVFLPRQVAARPMPIYWAECAHGGGGPL